MVDVFPANLNSWVRVANLNMTDPDQQCPENFQLYTDPIRLCGKSTTGFGCDSVTFTTNDVQYQQVCGRVRGYRYGAPDAFKRINCPSCTTNIDEPYVDGLA